MRFFRSLSALFWVIFSALLIVLLLSISWLLKRPASPAPISINQLEQILAQNSVDSTKKGVLLKKDELIIGERYTIPATDQTINLALKYAPIRQENDSYLSAAIFSVMALFALLVLIVFFKKRSSNDRQDTNKILKGSGLSLLDYYGPTYIQIRNSNVRFKDIAGINDVKTELTEVVDFLKNSKKYIDFGVKMPKGVLLVGPPGVGKTMLAKAVAGEAGVPFFYQNSSSFVEVYVGVGAKRVRQLFAKARSCAPSIVFLDEIDAVGRSRGGANEEREATLNQLLTEMDGFEENSGIIVIAATNKIEMLDEALLRPGRFDRRVHISLPNQAERAKILQSHMTKLSHDVDIVAISKMTVGFSGAALATLVNEAGLKAIRDGRSLVVGADFEAVMNKVIGLKTRVLSYTQDEQAILAQYQGAKAYVAYWLDVEFERISLLQDRFSDEKRELLSRTQLLNRIKVYLAGSEWLNISQNESYTNSKQDLAMAMDIATKMANEYEMTNELYPSASDIIKEARLEVGELLRSYSKQVGAVAEHLMRAESIDVAGLRAVLQEVI